MGNVRARQTLTSDANEAVEDYRYVEERYRILAQSRPDQATRLLELARQDVAARYQHYQQLAGDDINGQP